MSAIEIIALLTAIGAFIVVIVKISREFLKLCVAVIELIEKLRRK